MKLQVDELKLVKWIEKSFTVHKKYRGDYLVPTPYSDKNDEKLKLSISPSMGCFHCWRSDKSGPIWKLVQQLDKCNQQEAINKIYQKSNDISMYKSKIEFLKIKVKNILEESKKNIISLPKNMQLISSDEYKGEFNKKAFKYIKKRHIDFKKWKIGYCVNGLYKGRIIIPFYDSNENLIYWTARSIFDSVVPKYKNPDIQRENILFVCNWNFDNKDIYLSEGVFDAISLYYSGFNSVAISGKNLFESQIKILKKSKSITLALDNDNPGILGTLKCLESLRDYGYSGSDIKYIFPPIKDKDWNSCFISLGKDKIKEYILNNEKNFSGGEEIKVKLKLEK